MANSGIAGYFGGGTTEAGAVTTVDKFTFSSDARTTLGTGLSTGRTALAAMADSGVGGYIAGGSSSTTVDKFAFISDTRTTLATGLSVARNNFAGFANVAYAGYFAGGTSLAIDRFAFPSDTRSVLSATLDGSIRTPTGIAGLADSGVAGYFHGGGSIATRIIEKLDFVSETVATSAPVASPNRNNHAAYAHTSGL
jgi:hypothetical protein